MLAARSRGDQAKACEEERAAEGVSAIAATERMKRKTLRFGKGFRVALGNRRCQAAEMVDDRTGRGGGRSGETGIAERTSGCSW